MSPVLEYLLNHFGSSLFSFKPSAIVTYSAGQWGGVPAAAEMRAFLSELGYLPVSAMIHMPTARAVLAEDSAFLKGIDRDKWDRYPKRTFAQLERWAEAALKQQGTVGFPDQSQAFGRNPLQRNAP